MRRAGNSNEPDMLLRFPQPRQLIGSAGFLAAALPAPARAARTCKVRLVPRQNSAWQRAADRLESVLAAPKADGDCESVLIDVHDDGAELVYTTRDGRRAVRRLAQPSELEPTVEMLSVTGPAPASARVAVEPDRAAAPQPKVVAQTEHSRILFGGSLGARAGADALATPLLRAFGSIGLGHWELGVLGQWEMGYREMVEHPARARRASGFSGGITAARRQPLGENVALLVGGSLVLAALDEESAEHSATEGRAEGRIGGFVGAIFPRRARTRLRATLGADFSPSHFGKSPTNTQGVPLLPWWAATLTAGVEFGGP